MTTAAASPTAAILVIGNEILSGSVQDANIAFIAKRLAARGIILREVRIVRDEEGEIVPALNTLREKYSYVFTTGGIGPTHDDITSDCVAKAFGLPNDVHEGTRAKMQKHYEAQGSALNDARLRMAKMPKGAAPLECAASIAPGYNIGNVFVLAGVPRIMQAQFEIAEALTTPGQPVILRKVQCNQKEGDIAADLTAIQKKYPAIDIGSYPHMGEKPSLSLVLRGTDEALLESAVQDVAAMVRHYNEEPFII